MYKEQLKTQTNESIEKISKEIERLETQKENIEKNLSEKLSKNLDNLKNNKKEFESKLENIQNKSNDDVNDIKKSLNNLWETSNRLLEHVKSEF